MDDPVKMSAARSDGAKLGTNAPVLLIVTSAPLARRSGQLVFDDKAISGLFEYAASWKGLVHAVFRLTADDAPFMRPRDPSSFPFALTALEPGQAVPDDVLKKASVVLATGDNHLDYPIASACRRLNVPLVYTIENIPKTRHQIIGVSGKSLPRRLRSHLWTFLNERERRSAFALSSGLQCNGTPAAEEYSGLVSNIHTFFDTRVSDSNYATLKEMQNRRDRLMSGRPIQLVFSGRLERLKGADHLIPVVHHLRDLGVDFRFDVFGDGSLLPSMRAEATAADLMDKVTFHGSVDFESVLVPWVRSRTDLFLCCHVQSDPSCTYLETLACGVPILGYDNLAFAGILKRADVGWSVKLGDRKSMADVLRRLDRERQEIVRKSEIALAFAQQHSFEKTFRGRVEHLKAVSDAFHTTPA